MQIGLNKGSLTKLNQGSGIGNVQDNFKKEGVENKIQTCSSASIFNEIPENVVQEENKNEVNSSEPKNTNMQSVSIDIDSMIQGMLGDFVDSVKGAIEEAIKDKIQETIQEVIKDAVTNGVKENENADTSKESVVNDGKNNKAVFGDPNNPDWRNSKEIRDKIAAEEGAKVHDPFSGLSFLNNLKNARETNVDEIIGIHSEEDIKNVSGADLYELYSNFAESYGAADGNNIKKTAALVKILQYASKEQLQDFVKALKEEHPNSKIFGWLGYASENCGVFKEEQLRLMEKIDKWNIDVNQSKIGGHTAYYI